MKRRFAAALAFVVLTASLPLSAAPRDRDDRDPRPPQIIKIIKKLFGISTNSDLPSPPKP